MMWLRRIVALVMMLFVSTSVVMSSAVDIQGAFSDREDELAREYMEKYGWDEDQFLVRKWEAEVDGGKVEFERETGYQKEFLEDNMTTTRKYLGLSDTGSGGSLDSKGANELVKIALQEVSAEDNAEDPPDSNNVKYNTWFYGKEVSGDEYPWGCVFVSWCADQCDFISSGLFKKTNSSADLYKYMINENGFLSYAVKNTTPMGGTEYTPEPGDLMFFFAGEDDSSCTNVGIIVQVTANRIYVVEGNSNNKVEKNAYYKEMDFPEALNGRIVHVQYPLTFADGGSTEANAPIIFSFLTEYMNLSPAAACGAMGNMVNESHLMPDTTEYGYTWESGAGYGLIQWTNVEGNHRVSGTDSAYLIKPGETSFQWLNGHNRTNLVNWCTANGYDYKTLAGQLFFLKYQLTASPDKSYYATAMNKLSQQPNTLAGALECSDIWLQRVEGLPRTNRYWATQSPLRRNSTAQFWSQYGQSS